MGCGLLLAGSGLKVGVRVVVLARGEGLIGWWVAGVEGGDVCWIGVVDEVDFFFEVGLRD